MLQKRTDNARWGLPGGGVERDETALSALKREVMEETSLEVIETEAMALYCGPNQKFTYPNGDAVQCFAIAFIVCKWKGKPHPDGVEGSGLRFFPANEIPEDLVTVHKQTIEDYRRYKGVFLLSG